jgi:hypothetical protein
MMKKTNVLDIIKRKNLEMNKIEEVFELCEAHNIPLYTELILGLPGETLETWKNNFYRLYKAGNHTGITIYQAQLLENAEMNLLQRKLYKIQGRTVYDYLVGTYNENELKEGVEVVTATKDLPPAVMLDAQVFSWFMNTFHINGLTNYISRFLFKHKNIDYDRFYSGLFEYIKQDPWLNSEIDRIREHYGNWALHGKIDHTPIQGIEIHGWNLVHSTIINLHSQGKGNHIFSIIAEYTKQFELEDRLFDQLIEFQKTYIVDHSNIASYPRVVNTDYNFLSYIQGTGPLDISAQYEFEFPEDKHMSLQQFCEQIFFARRRNFGKSWIKEL